MAVFSMTGFGHQLEDFPEGRLSVEVRTLNARGREVGVHGSGLLVDEAACRELAAGRFARGKVDITLRFEPHDRARPDSVPDFIEELRTRISGRDILMQEALLARLIMAIEGSTGARRTPDLDPAAVLAAVSGACEKARGHRLQEGARMGEAITGVLLRLREHLATIEARGPVQAQATRERLERRIAELVLPQDPDPGSAVGPAFAREIAQMADRADIHEELARLKTHFARIDEALVSDRPVGRELDFICQELLRETNTIGSKSVDSGITAAVISMKTGCEQVRELAANLE